MFLTVRTRGTAHGTKRPWAMVLPIGLVALAFWAAAQFAGAPVVRADESDDEELGAVTADFELPGDLPMEFLVPGLERDRVYMSARPGFMHKHVPLSPDFATGNFFSGGRYLFNSVEDAEAYKDWLVNDFVLDGVKFFDRPQIMNPEVHVWNVIGAEDFADIHTSQVVVRTERWATPAENQRGLLKELWPAIRAEAKRRGYTAAWLLYSKREQLVSLVYFANRVVPPDPDVPDFISLIHLATDDSLGQAFDDVGWAKRFNRTQWVLTIWFPFERGDEGDPSVWPNSPPFPAP
jgi:hypothetical protein